MESVWEGANNCGVCGAGGTVVVRSLVCSASSLCLPEPYYTQQHPQMHTHTCALKPVHTYFCIH